VVVERLAAATPADLAKVELASYKGLLTPWSDWKHVEARGRHFAELLAGTLLGGRAS